jgi:hypothetical protein
MAVVGVRTNINRIKSALERGKDKQHLKRSSRKTFRNWSTERKNVTSRQYLKVVPTLFVTGVALVHIHQTFSSHLVATAPVVFHVSGVRLCLWTAACNGPIDHTPGDIWEWRATVERYWQGKVEELGETCPSATFNTTYPTLTDPVANPVLSGKKPVAKRLSQLQHLT